MVENFMKRSDQFFRSFRRNNEDGFTLMEMVIAIPLIALTGGFTVLVIGNSLSQQNSNTLAINAASESELVIGSLKKSRNCYELTNLTNTDWNSESKISSSNKANEFRNNFTITTDIVGKEGNNECISGTANKIRVQAINDKNSKVLFTTTASVVING